MRLVGDDRRDLLKVGEVVGVDAVELGLGEVQELRRRRIAGLRERVDPRAHQILDAAERANHEPAGIRGRPGDEAPARDLAVVIGRQEQVLAPLTLVRACKGRCRSRSAASTICCEATSRLTATEPGRGAPADETSLADPRPSRTARPPRRGGADKSHANEVNGEGQNRTGDTTIFSAERERKSWSSEGEVDDGTPANQELRLFDD